MAGQHRTLQISHLQRVELAIRQLWEQVAAIPFRHDVRSEDVPDYYNVVRTPMSLTTVLGKLTRNEYPNPNTVRGDMDVLFKNCFTYNMPGCPIYKYGQQLQTAFEELLVDVGVEGRKRPTARRYEEFGESLRYAFLDDSNAKRGKKRFHSGVAAGQRPFKKQFCPKIVGGEIKRRAIAPEFPASSGAHDDEDDDDDEEDEEEEERKQREIQEQNDDDAHELDEQFRMEGNLLGNVPAAPPSPSSADAVEVVEVDEAADDPLNKNGVPTGGGAANAAEASAAVVPEASAADSAGEASKGGVKEPAGAAADKDGSSATAPMDEDVVVEAAVASPAVSAS